VNIVVDKSWQWLSRDICEVCILFWSLESTGRWFNYC